MAAALACGDKAVVSHRSAAALWNMLSSSSAPIEVTFAGYGGRRRRTGIVIHRTATLTSGATTRCARIPVTNPARTLMDLRAMLSTTQLQKATRRALDLRLDVTEALSPEPDLTRSELERMFLRFVRDHSLPSPEVNARVGPFEVDFLWPDVMLIVETDGYRHHAHRSAFEADRARDAQLQALGYRVLRFTYRQIKHESQRVVATLNRVMRASAQRVPAPRL
jgi:very-short-patch-repair endonuclease